MKHIKDNVFTHDTFFKRDKDGFSAVSKKKKRVNRVSVDSTEMPSKNYGASKGSSQNKCGQDYRYKGDMDLTPRIKAKTVVEYLATLPYMISGMDVVLKEKLLAWNPKGEKVEEKVQLFKEKVRWEEEELIKDFEKWKK